MKRIVSVLSVLLLVACGANDKNDLNALLKKEAELQKQLEEVKEQIKSLRKDSAEAILVAVEQLHSDIFRSYLTFQAKVDAEDNINVSTEMPGTITRIYVTPGDQVKAGQILAETDARALQQSIQALESNLDFVNELYEKQKKLWDQKIGTEVQYLQVKAQKENLEKTLNSLQEQLRMTRIISPIDGTVDAVDIKVGQMVAPGMPAIRVVNFNHLKIKADIPENYLAEIRPGLPVQIIVNGKDTLHNKISYVSRTISNVSRTFNVEVHIGNNPALHTNQMVLLRINNYTSEKPVIALPIEYIQTDYNNQKYVYVVENNRVKKRMITVGKISDQKAEILSGLQENDNVIKAAVNLVENAPVIIEDNIPL